MAGGWRADERERAQADGEGVHGGGRHMDTGQAELASLFEDSFEIQAILGCGMKRLPRLQEASQGCFLASLVIGGFLLLQLQARVAVTTLLVHLLFLLLLVLFTVGFRDHNESLALLMGSKGPTQSLGLQWPQGNPSGKET